MVRNQEHRDLAREAVRKSLVLLKNGKNQTNPVLPLPKGVKKILVTGSHADNLGYQCGGWTISWQGFSGNNSTRGMFSFPLRDSNHKLYRHVFCLDFINFYPCIQV